VLSLYRLEHAVSRRQGQSIAELPRVAAEATDRHDANMLTAASASGAANEAITPVGARSSGPRTLRMRHGDRGRS
jgi:hypothetical protein